MNAQLCRTMENHFDSQVSFIGALNNLFREFSRMNVNAMNVSEMRQVLDLIKSQSSTLLVELENIHSGLLTLSSLSIPGC